MFTVRPGRNEYFVKDIRPKQSSTHGIGVFATKPIKVHTCIERSPVITFDNSIFIDFAEAYDINHILYSYVFRGNDGKTALPWGYGCLYNHSPENNATWKWTDSDDDFGYAIEFWTIKDIEAGEEIFTRYFPFSHKLSFLDEREEEYLGITRNKFDNSL